MLYIGIDIGGTKCAAVVGNSDGKIFRKRKFESGNACNPFDIIDRYKEIIDDFFEEFNKDEFKAIGISCGGPLDSKRGIIMSPPNLPLWDSINIVELLNKHTGLPVYLQNDANACALAEWKVGAGKGSNNMIFLTFGTGLGAGLILNGNLYEGSSGMAGEVGHIRLTEDGPIGYNKKGSFEGYCSGGGIKNLAQIIISEKLRQGKAVEFCKSMEELNNITAKVVFEHAFLHDETAMEIVNICAEKLGRGLSVLIDILNPDCIVLGSIYQRAEVLLREKALEVIKIEALRESREICVIKPALLSEEIGDIASLMVAIVNCE